MDNRSTSTGTLYGVSVGPGDPELMTVKAVRVLEACPVVAAPITESGHERALEIITGAIDLAGKRILELSFPMSRDPDVLDAARTKAADAIAAELDAGRNVAFVTLGDASVWSTFTRMLERLKDRYHVEVVPGVTSFSAAAARLGVSLTRPNEPLCVVPAGALSVDEALALPGTKVLMKSGAALADVVDALRAHGLADRAAMVQRCGMPGERAFETLPLEDDFDDTYFTTIVVRP